MMNMNFKLFLEKMSISGSPDGTIYQRLVSASYMIMPKVTEEGKKASEELAEKIQNQYNQLSKKYDFVRSDDTVNADYQDTEDIAQDINRQRQQGVVSPKVKVFDQEHNHPVLSPDSNYKLRAVHDMIAHYPKIKAGPKQNFGYSFKTSRGEYCAYNRHLKTICPDASCLAGKILFTEIIAQTSCYFIYGGFVDQKAVILHDFDHANIGRLSESSGLNRFFIFDQNYKKLIKRNNFNESEFENYDRNLYNELKRQGKVSKIALEYI